MHETYAKALSIALEQTSPALARRRQPALDQLFAGSEDETTRLDLARFCWDMYRGDQLRHVPRLPGESALEYSRRPHKQFLNVTRVLVDVLSQLYRQPISRRLDAGAATERIQRAYTRNPMGQIMLTVDRLTRLQGACALRVGYQDGEIRLWPYPAHRLIVVPDPTMPLRPLAVVAFAAGDEGSTPLAHVWTAESVTTVHQGRVAGEVKHTLGRVPFVFFHDALPVDGFWSEGRGRSITHANAIFNAKLSELAYTVAMQGFGVMEIVNPDPAKDIAIGPGRAIAFTVGQGQPYGVSFKAPNAPIAELIADLEFQLRTLLKTQRIPESVLSVNVGGNVSGASIVAAGSPVIEDRVERMQLFRAGEADLLDAIAAVLREHEGVQAQAPTLALDFPEPRLEQTVADRIALDDWRLDRGMTTPWELMLRDDPDAYDNLEAAKQAWLARRAEMRTLNIQTERDA
ncbi:MAG: hypothetical protein IT462_05770 [Planctomycetes bacterium]|nr:hypothetical protein [Planctomycetota bacterium]